MSFPDRRAAVNNLRTIVLTGGTITAVALLFAIPSVLPTATATAAATGEMIQNVAEEARQSATPPIDTSRLAKWSYTLDPSVSIEPLRESTVTKIAGGKVTTVHVVETATGVYSSDALDNPHVLYPGIHRSRATHPDAGTGLLLLNDRRWVAAVPVAANSIVTVLPFDGGKLIVRDGFSCVVTKTLSTC